jgi:hypothetical protein
MSEFIVWWLLALLLVAGLLLNFIVMSSILENMNNRAWQKSDAISQRIKDERVLIAKSLRLWGRSSAVSDVSLWATRIENADYGAISEVG